jgi:signal transduction histidine kinase/CheY-like chemotaxis protein
MFLGSLMNHSYILQVGSYTISYVEPMLSTFYHAFLKTIREQELLSFLVVFLSLLVTAKFGQAIFFTLQTSPALIWPPTGIALAALLIGGYRMWLPIALAQSISTFTSPASPSLAVVAASTIAYTVMPIIAVYLLKRLGFQSKLNRTRDALMVIATALFLPIFAPAVVTAAQWATGALTATPWTSWSRAWAGSVFSIMVLTPTILSWFSYIDWRRVLEKKRMIIETILVVATLMLSTYAVFWTTLPQQNIFITLYLFFAVLFWIGLRLGPRMMSISLFIVTAVGILGSIFGHPSAVPLNQQLFADELFIILIAPIFLILSALVEERRITAERLGESIAELQSALEKLGREDESKNEFIATLAHELRNPLAPVVSTLEYLKLEKQEPETHRLIQNAEEQTHIMRRLLDDLLDVARVTQKRFKLQEESLTLQSAVIRSVQTVDLFIQSNRHALSVSLPEEPLWAYGDPVRLTQIFTNILFNAAKYTPQGGQISIEAYREGGEGVVAIIDNGIGIEPSRLERIFEPFLHTGPHQTVGAGLGIGLSLTKRLVDMHRGGIEAYSEGVDKGSRFVVRIPLSATEGAFDTSKPFVYKPELIKQFRILVVDDNESAAQSIEKLLTRKGHQVEVAYDGISAIDAAVAHRPDVVLLDIGLPDIDGYEVARQLREFAPSPYIVALTGYGQDEDKTKARQAGFNFHLTKPVALADIENILHAVHE